MTKCLNAYREHENHYGDKYGGYCLECSNAGVVELETWIAALRTRAEQAEAALAAMRLWLTPDRRRAKPAGSVQASAGSARIGHSLGRRNDHETARE